MKRIDFIDFNNLIPANIPENSRRIKYEDVYGKVLLCASKALKIKL